MHGASVPQISNDTLIITALPDTMSTLLKTFESMERMNESGEVSNMDQVDFHRDKSNQPNVETPMNTQQSKNASTSSDVQ